MALQSTWPLIDNVPAAHGKTFDISAVGADVDVTNQSGMPVAPSSAIEARSTTGGVLIVTMAGGGNASVFIPAGGSVYRRISVKALVFTGTTADVDVTVYWDPNSKKNP